MKIEPLSKKTLASAVELVNSIFPDQTKYEKADYVLSKSLDWQTKKKPIHRSIEDNRYWVAVEREKVIGLVGLYVCKKDMKEANWLGWFCVSKLHRRRDLGKKLLDFAINKTQSMGKKYLRLYSSEDPVESAAQKLYEKTGFRFVGKKGVKGRKYKDVFWELKL